MAFETNRQAATVWTAVLGKLELSIPRPSFETWIKNSVGLSIDEENLTVSVEDAFTAQYLKDRMSGIIETKLRDVTGQNHRVVFSVKGNKNIRISDNPETQPIAMQDPQIHNTSDFNSDNNQGPLARMPKLNPRYTFENFVLGDSNELALAGAKAAAENPGHTFNPLVIYSDVGLGKTHLLHAIGHEVSKKGLNCIYVTCEEFTNQYVKSIQQGTTEKFRDFYRSSDVLLLDDVQFLIAKEQTQEGFFHTFNALHMANKQIVVTSDRPVSSLNVLEQRITSRLAGGLVADMQPPPFETRLAILQEKSSRMDCDVPSDVLEYLARRVQSNVRDLEGSLNRVIAWSQFRESSISLDDVTILIGESWATMRGKTITDSAVISAVSEHFGIATDQIRGKGRRKMTVLSRQVAMYLLREETDLSFTAIGRILGGRDHSTVLHGHERVSVKIEQDDSLRNDVIKIRHSLMGKF